MDQTIFPPPRRTPDSLLGLYPTDFIVEDVLDDGLKWFRSTPGAEQQVFGRLLMPAVIGRYGQAKIDEIAKYIRGFEIRIIQAFPVEDTQMPAISINLADANQPERYEALTHYAGAVDSLGPSDEVVGRKEIGYLPIQDSILIGIHATGTPDKVKYLYYLVSYVIASALDRFNEMGFIDVSLRATDMSRFNDLLPANVYTRFLTLSVSTVPKYEKGVVPMVDSFNVNVRT